VNNLLLQSREIANLAAKTLGLITVFAWLNITAFIIKVSKIGATTNQNWPPFDA